MGTTCEGNNKGKFERGGKYIDVGANIGLHSVYASGIIGANGKIYAFEPNKRLYKILVDNMDINGLIHNEVAVLYNSAVSNYTGEGTMYIYPGHAGGSGMRQNDEYMRDFDVETVSVLKLDDVIKEDVDFIKVDVEGFELSVLEGAKRLLQNPDITLIIEWQVEDMKNALGEGTAEKLYMLLKNMGFKAYMARYEKPIRSIDIQNEKMPTEICDMVFTRKNHIDELVKSPTVIANSVMAERGIEYTSETENETEKLKRIILELQEKNKFAEKAFYDAVDVQEKLKMIINKPTGKDLLRCMRNFIIRR